MKIDVPDKLINEIIDACIIQTSGSIHSVESRSNQATRMQWHVAEQITALIAKELRNRKYITYDPPRTPSTGGGDERKNQGKQGPIC